jgi:hypothetical protein
MLRLLLFFFFVILQQNKKEGQLNTKWQPIYLYIVIIRRRRRKSTATTTFFWARPHDEKLDHLTFKFEIIYSKNKFSFCSIFNFFFKIKEKFRFLIFLKFYSSLYLY